MSSQNDSQNDSNDKQSIEEKKSLEETTAEQNQATEVEPEAEELHTAANDWKPELEAPSNDGPATLIRDPFQIPSVDQDELDALDEDSVEFDSEITKESESEQEEEPSEDLGFLSDEEVEDHLESLSQSIGTEEKQKEQELESLSFSDDVQETTEEEYLQNEYEEETNEDTTDESEAPEMLELDEAEIQASVETLLFLSDRPLSEKRLKELLEVEFEEGVFENALHQLKERYQSPIHGIELVEVAGGLQFRTKPGKVFLAKKLAKIQPQRLSKGAMETLAIVAYKQPIMKDEIDQIRGVDSSHFIRGLIDRKLVEINGRSDLPGRPIVYGTAEKFLEIFGLNSLSDLPPLGELEGMVPSLEQLQDETDPKIKKLRQLVDEMKSAEQTDDYNPVEDEKILKEIREKIRSVPTTTPYLEEQKELQKNQAQNQNPDALV